MYKLFRDASQCIPSVKALLRKWAGLSDHGHGVSREEYVKKWRESGSAVLWEATHSYKPLL
jgi:hypothetical protein